MKWIIVIATMLITGCAKYDMPQAECEKSCGVRRYRFFYANQIQDDRTQVCHCATEKGWERP